MCGFTFVGLKESGPKNPRHEARKVRGVYVATVLSGSLYLYTKG